MIKNFPVKIDYVNLVEKIIGPDIRALIFKITGIKLKPIKDNLVEIPTEQTGQRNNLLHCIDIMLVNHL